MQRIYEDEGASFDQCHVFDEHGSIIPQQIDNLYLDCNGIVHPCCHPEGGAKQPENEEEMFLNIHALIDRLFNITKPKNLVSGVPSSDRCFYYLEVNEKS
jgi:5'-3' exonuclease